MITYPLTDWTEYRHGHWRRIGDSMECYSSKRTIPAGFIPLQDAKVFKFIPIQDAKVFKFDSLDFKYYIYVKIKGWETITLRYASSDLSTTQASD